MCAMKFQSCGKGYSLPCLRKYMQNFRHLIGGVFRNEKECKDKPTGSVSQVQGHENLSLEAEKSVLLLELNIIGSVTDFSQQKLRIDRYHNIVYRQLKDCSTKENVQLTNVSCTRI